MPRGDDDVAHAGLLGQCDPLRGVELDRVELRGELFVLRAGEVMGLHYPFTVTQQAVDAPVDEHAEARLLEPSARLQIFGGRLIVGLGGEREGKSDHRARDIAQMSHQASSRSAASAIGSTRYGDCRPSQKWWSCMRWMMSPGPCIT